MNRNNDKKKPKKQKAFQTEGLNQISPRNVEILGMAGFLLVTGRYSIPPEDRN